MVSLELTSEVLVQFPDGQQISLNCWEIEQLQTAIVEGLSQLKLIMVRPTAGEELLAAFSSVVEWQIASVNKEPPSKEWLFVLSLNGLSVTRTDHAI